MRTEVRIAEFKGKLSRYLRSVQKGHEVVIKDRETPIARLVPYQDTKIPPLSNPPTGSLKELDELPFYAPENLTLQEVEDALRQERRERLDGLL